jgi:hypothetical protein
MLKACGWFVEGASITMGKGSNLSSPSTDPSRNVVERTLFVHKLSTANCFFKQAFSHPISVLQHLKFSLNTHFPLSLIRLMN